MSGARIRGTVNDITNLLFEYYNKFLDDVVLSEKAMQSITDATVSKYEIMNRVVMRFLEKVIFVQLLECWRMEPVAIDRDVSARLMHETGDPPARDFIIASIESKYRKYNGPSHGIDKIMEKGFQISPALLEALIRDFSALDLSNLTGDMFGIIYEHFLHKIVEKKAKNENERKMFGQYYTPDHVVDYIIQEIVVPVIHSHAGDLRELKIIDPACGSGSFLVKIYDALHDEYTRRKEIARGKLMGNISMSDNMSTVEATFHNEVANDYDPINDPLKHNIFAIDVIPEATELAILNLVVRKLAKSTGEDGSTILAELGRSIDDERGCLPPSRVACADAMTSDWQDLFSINEKFDIVIGNPPYVEYNNLSKDYRRKISMSKNFSQQYSRWDLYTLFMERGFSNLADKGSIAYIIPGSFLDEQYAYRLRVHIARNYSIDSIVDLRKCKIFAGADVGTIIFHVKNENVQCGHLVKIKTPDIDSSEPVMLGLRSFEIPQENFLRLPDCSWRLVPRTSWEILDAVQARSIPISFICYLTMGLQISPLGQYQSEVQREVIIKQVHDAKEGLVEESVIVNVPPAGPTPSAAGETELFRVASKPYLKGDGILPYYISQKKTLFFLYSDNKAFYLKLKSLGWRFSESAKNWKVKFPQLFENPKLVIPRVAGLSVKCALDLGKHYCDQTVLIVIQKAFIKDVAAQKFAKSSPSLSNLEIQLSEQFDIHYLLGVINSRPVRFFFKTFLGNGLDVLKFNVEHLPVPIKLQWNGFPRVNLSPHEQDTVVRSVKEIIALSARLHDTSQNQRDLKQIKERIDILQEVIDVEILKQLGLIDFKDMIWNG